MMAVDSIRHPIKKQNISFPSDKLHIQFLISSLPNGCCANQATRPSHNLPSIDDRRVSPATIKISRKQTLQYMRGSCQQLPNSPHSATKSFIPIPLL